LASVPPRFTTYDGDDPWTFSIAKNKCRRHLTIDQLALAAARLATRGQGAPIGNRHAAKTTGSNELVVSGTRRPTIAQAAEAAGLPKTAIKSGKTVNERGTAAEIESVQSGKAKLRKVATAVRSRTRQPARPPVKQASIDSADPIRDLAKVVLDKCGDCAWRPFARLGRAVGAADSAVLQALDRLGPNCVWARRGSSGLEFLIERNKDAGWRHLLVEKEEEVAGLCRQLDEKGGEIARLRKELSAASAPALVLQ
jgi:hypothetical protein